MRAFVEKNGISGRTDTIALYAALALFFSIVELLIPKPIPFFRIGLANLPLLVALTFLTGREFIILVLLKIVGQAIVGGTLFSYVFLFSASGSLASGLVMLLLRPLSPRLISLVGIGVWGALASNAAQLVFAALLIFGSSTRLVAPVLLLMGTVSGTLLGVTAQFVLKKSRWVRSLQGSGTFGGDHEDYQDRYVSSFRRPENRMALVHLFFGLMMIPPFILQASPLLKLMHILIILLYSRILGLRVRVLPGVLIVVAVTAAGVLNPIGEVVFSIASFPITAGALLQGLERGLNLVGMVYLSRCAVSSDLRIPGKAGHLLYRVFYYFEELSSLRLKRKGEKGLKRNLRERLLEIDEMLLNWSSSGHRGRSTPSEAGVGGRLPKSFGIPVLFLFLQWLVYALDVCTVL